MTIPPKYILTPKITQSLQVIEACKVVIETLQIPQEVETNIRRQSVLKSSLFSARIEGNPLTLDDITNRSSKDQKKIEVFNILKGIQEVHNRGARDLSLSFILKLHEQVMKGLTDTPGKFRTEVSAIFNTAGIAIYMPPPPGQINRMMERLITYSNGTKEPFIPIRACLVHYSFEKIHPFLDGNGRVGRLLIQSVLQKSGYGMKGFLSLEEYLDEHRNQYYSALEESERDVTGYLEFMLDAIASVSETAKSYVINHQHGDIHDSLLPRRSEILHIIEEHKLVNFDQIRRRFLAVNERTLRYDLKKLQDANLIRKRGRTNGVYYVAVEK